MNQHIVGAQQVFVKFLNCFIEGVECKNFKNLVSLITYASGANVKTSGTSINDKKGWGEGFFAMV